MTADTGYALLLGALLSVAFRNLYLLAVDLIRHLRAKQRELDYTDISRTDFEEEKSVSREGGNKEGGQGRSIFHVLIFSCQDVIMEGFGKKQTLNEAQSAPAKPRPNPRDPYRAPGAEA